jgi:hypothetical protein
MPALARPRRHGRTRRSRPSTPPDERPGEVRRVRPDGDAPASARRQTPEAATPPGRWRVPRRREGRGAAPVPPPQLRQAARSPVTASLARVRHPGQGTCRAFGTAAARHTQEERRRPRWRYRPVLRLWPDAHSRILRPSRSSLSCATWEIAQRPAGCSARLPGVAQAPCGSWPSTAPRRRPSPRAPDRSLVLLIAQLALLGQRRGQRSALCCLRLP